MDTVVGGLIYFGVVAALAAGLVLALRFFANGMTRKRRLAIASLAAAATPTLIPMTAVLVDGGGDPEIWVVLVTLLVMTLFLAAVVALPAALLTDRRLERSGSGSGLPD